ncbi:MAG: hypothetical protein PSX80_06685 [bacterium]|nr:hypothetical protein [bacterium]
MNIFQLSLSTFVFGITLLLGTSAVIAARFVITTVGGLTKSPATTERVAVPVAEPEPATRLEDLRNDLATIDDFDPTGTYFLNSETLPQAFAEIEFLDIETREYNEDREIYSSRNILPIGSLQTKKRFSFTKIAVGNREIAFETTTVDGLSYQFVGQFPVLTEVIECEGCEYPANLTGRLKKLKNGKVIAEFDAKFYIGGC